MSRVKVGLVRVLTLHDEEALNLHGKLIEEKFPSLHVISKCIEGFPKGLYNPEVERKAIPHIIRLIEEFEKDGMKAVIVSCADDPGVKEARKIVNIPVIGAGTAVASVALIYGDRVGVLGITDEVPNPIREILKDRIVGYEKPYGINNTLDIVKNKNEIIKSAKRLIDLNIDAIVLACTGYSTARTADLLKKITDIPIIDPVIASGLLAYYSVGLPI